MFMVAGDDQASLFVDCEGNKENLVGDTRYVYNLFCSCLLYSIFVNLPQCFALDQSGIHDKTYIIIRVLSFTKIQLDITGRRLVVSIFQDMYLYSVYEI